MQYIIKAKDGAPTDWQDQVKNLVKTTVGGNDNGLLVYASKKDLKPVEDLGFCEIDLVEIKLPPGISS